jgi:GTP-binding protein
MRRHWGALVDAYFAARASLHGVVVVMDARHALSPHDRAMLELAGSRALPVHVLLTKSDKLGRAAAKSTLQAVRGALEGDVTVQLFSSLKGEGLAEARSRLNALLTGPKKENPG